MQNKYEKELDYEKKEQKLVYQGKRISIEEVKYYNPREDKKIYREHVLAGNAVVIMPITQENEFIMIREPRTPIEKMILTFPAGKIEQAEPDKQAALRELEEEIGYRANTIQKIREVYPTVGYSNEKVSLFMATDLVKTKRHLDPTEDIEVIKIPIEEVKQMLDKGEITTVSEIILLMQYFFYGIEK